MFFLVNWGAPVLQLLCWIVVWVARAISASFCFQSSVISILKACHSLLVPLTLFPYLFSTKQKEEDTNTSAGDPPRKKPTRLAIGKKAFVYDIILVVLDQSFGAAFGFMACRFCLSSSGLVEVNIPDRIQTSCFLVCFRWAVSAKQLLRWQFCAVFKVASCFL